MRRIRIAERGNDQRNLHRRPGRTAAPFTETEKWCRPTDRCQGDPYRCFNPALQLREVADERCRVARPDLAIGDGHRRDDTDSEHPRHEPDDAAPFGDIMGVRWRFMPVGAASTGRAGSRHELLAAIAIGSTSTWLYRFAPPRYLSAYATCGIEHVTVGQRSASNSILGKNSCMLGEILCQKNDPRQCQNSVCFTASHHGKTPPGPIAADILSE